MGRMVRVLRPQATVSGAPATAIDGTAHWDGRDDLGRRVGRGVYLVRLDAPEGGSSSARVTVTR
jgi:hypothetical protein